MMQRRGDAARYAEAATAPAMPPINTATTKMPIAAAIFPLTM